MQLRSIDNTYWSESPWCSFEKFNNQSDDHWSPWIRSPKHAPNRSRHLAGLTRILNRAHFHSRRFPVGSKRKNTRNRHRYGLWNWLSIRWYRPSLRKRSEDWTGFARHFGEKWTQEVRKTGNLNEIQVCASILLFGAFWRGGVSYLHRFVATVTQKTGNGAIWRQL